jgi:membrane fusion protein (multidrug efflux system)
VGTLRANEIVSIQGEIDAVVERIAFSEGEVVEKGQVLFELDDAKLTATVKKADANFKLAETILERNKKLLKSRTISQQDFDRSQATYLAVGAALELARQNLEDATITAPFSGIMAERLVSSGQFISRGLVLCTLVDLDPIKAEFSVPERFISQLELEQRIEIRLASYPAESFEGVVYFIAPRLDTSTRTVLVKAKVSNEDGRLKAGMFGNLDLILKTKEKAIVIPEIAISYNGDQASVYVVSKEMQAELRFIEVGLRLAGSSEITEGLEAGDLVITEGFQKIGPGSPVMISPKSNLASKEPEVLEIHGE